MQQFARTCFLLLPGTLFAAQLLPGSLTLSPATSGTSLISYSSTGNEVSGLQFDLVFDSPAISVLVVSGPSIRSAGKILYTAGLGAGSTRILVAGTNQNSLGDGGVVTIFVNVAPNADPGMFTLGIKNAIGADPSGNAVAIPDAFAAVTISSQPGNGTPIQSGGVLNAASWLSGPVSAGEVVTLIGAGIGPTQPATLRLLASGLVTTKLSNTTVSFGSVQAPLIYAGLNQINLVVPFELSGQTNTILTVTQDGQEIASLAVPVAASAPGVFTQNASGAGPVAALNEDGSLNTPVNPATQGSIITLYVTGAGPINPPGLTGSITATAGNSLLPTAATIAGLPADVIYSGPAPGVIAGVSQVNLRVPIEMNSSVAAPLSIQIGGVATQDGATLSVR